MKVTKKLSFNNQGVSILVEYIVIAGILTIFMFFITVQLNDTFIDIPTKIVMQNQFEDIGNQITAKMVDVALVAPESGSVNVKLYMPYSIGDHDYRAGFIQSEGDYVLEIRANEIDKVAILPIGNIGLQVIPEGYTFSLDIENELSYTSSSHLMPTAVALAYPTTSKTNSSITFDMTYSTGEGNLHFEWNFGDGNIYSGQYDPSDPESALIQHSYSSEGNYSAILTVTDDSGYSDVDTINITIIPNNPDPFLFADKYVIPDNAEPNEPIKIVIFLKGGGIAQTSRQLSAIHLIDTSGSMDPDYYSGGYSQYTTTSSSVSPSKWEGNVTVDSSFKRMRIRAQSSSEDIDLWVKSPDSDFARAQYIGSGYETYYVFNPQDGLWDIVVVADYPTGSDSVTVTIQKKTSRSWWAPWKNVATYNFVLPANAETYNLTLPNVENFMIEVSPFNGSKLIHYWVEHGSISGPYSPSNDYETSNTNGDYTIYFVGDFPYGSQEFNVNTYIAKIDAAKIAAKSFNSYLSSSDRIGVAYFNGTGWGGRTPKYEVVQTLTNNFNNANNSIDSLAAYGGTPMGAGIYIAKEELELRSPVNTAPVIILLSDGNPTLTSWGSVNTDAAIQEAVDNATDAKSTVINGENILIYTIGFGGDANETLLKEIASSPSYYFYAATSEELQSIYNQIARELKEKAAQNVTITDVLPDGIELTTPPTGANITYEGGITTLQWNVSAIMINQTWTVTFYVTPEEEGIHETNVYGLSNVTYMPYPFSAVPFNTIYLPSGEVRVESLVNERVELS